MQEVMLAERPGENAAPAGLGNYKGVMLCNRPEANTNVKSGPAPFTSAVSETYNQPLGLNPVGEKATHEPQVPTVCPAMLRHAEWLKKLSVEMKNHKSTEAERRTAQAAKIENVKKLASRQREGVRKLFEERDRMEEQEKADQNLRKELHTAVSAPDYSKIPLKNKPLWAMSADEKSEFDVIESDELINFAEMLNFDEYIHDLEFRTALETLRGRAQKINDEQNSFKDELVKALNEEDMESAGGETADSFVDQVKAAEKGMAKSSDWDASTSVGEKREEDQEIRSHADVILANNAEIRSIHSKESVKKILEHQKKAKQEAKDKEAANSISSSTAAEILQVAQNCTPPNPTIVSHESIGSKNKVVDPSMLPYLYRSPAI